MVLVSRADAVRLTVAACATCAALALAGCSEGMNSALDKIAASPATPMPERTAAVVPKGTDMGGRWMLTMPGTGACGVMFGFGPADGAVTPESGCPGKFIASRSWAIAPAGVVIRDQSGIALASLRMAEPGRLEGQTADGAQVLLTR
jgi:hypothetical protein